MSEKILRYTPSISFRFAVLIFFLPIAFESTTSATRAGYLIIEHPQQLVIYNQYQQRVSPSEKSAFLSNVPFRILNSNDVLGDGFTRCMKVELGGKNFFLEKDENGTLLGAEGAGARQQYNAAEVLEDTIEILRSDRLVLSDMHLLRTADVEVGARILRVFRLDGNVYGKLLGSNERYGWINLGDAASRDWRVAREFGLSVSDQLQKILPQIEIRLKEVNEKLNRLYEHFNKKSAQRRQPPQWELRRAGNSISCILLPEGSADQISESSILLGKNFEGLLLGTDLRVAVSPGRLEIRSEATE